MSERIVEAWISTTYRRDLTTRSGLPKEARKMTEREFPKVWDEQRVKNLLAELDARTEGEWVAADEAAASESDEQTVVTVPTALLPEIRRLLATAKSA
jgi:hypothetical protein